MPTPFLQQLRMNSLFPPGSPSGNIGGNESLVAPPDMNPGPSDYIKNTLNKIMAERQLNQQRSDFTELYANAHGNNPIYQTQGQNLNNIANQVKQPAHLIRDPNEMTDFQKGTLDLGKQRLAERTTNDQGDLGFKKESLAEKDQYGKSSLEIKNKTQQLNDWKAHNPNGKILMPKGGNIVVIDPQTGEATDTGVSSGSLSEEDKLTLTGEQKINQINTKDTNKDQQIVTTGEQNRLTKQTVPGANPKSNTQTSASQQKIKLESVLNEHPEWRSFIATDSNTGQSLIRPTNPPPYGPGNPDKETYQNIYKALYGKGDSKNNPPIQDNSTKSSELVKPTVTGDRIRVTDPKGQSGSWPTNKPLPDGYKKIEG